MLSTTWHQIICYHFRTLIITYIIWVGTEVFTAHGLCTIFVQIICKGAPQRLHMDSSYKSAENYLGKGESNCNTSGTTSAQTMGRCSLKSMQILSQGINIHFLHLICWRCSSRVKFANRTLQWDVCYIRKTFWGSRQ